MNRASRSSWLATIGIVVAVVGLWRPGLSASPGAGHRLVLNLPEWLAIPMAAAALLMFVAMLTPRRSAANASRFRRSASGSTTTSPVSRR